MFAYLKMPAFLAISLLFTACSSNKQREQHSELAMKDVTRLKTTPVKDQGPSQTCWIYAMLATIETEHIMRGDSVNLSVDYVSRMLIREKAAEHLASNEEDYRSMRGVASNTLRLIQTYGLHHFDAYHSRHEVDYATLMRKSISCMRTAFSYKSAMENVDEMLDKEISPLPLRVYMYGVEYTPLEFAHSVCRDDEYHGYTSFSHHPFGIRIPLESPDNIYHDLVTNIPIDSMLAMAERSIRSGHPVCWEGDISEKGFIFEKGVVTLDRGINTVTQDMRQREYETGRTTDDHCMEMMGLAIDNKGMKYFICKNSWGTNNRYKGYMYMSYQYMMMKTIAIFVPEE